MSRTALHTTVLLSAISLSVLSPAAAEPPAMPTRDYEKTIVVRATPQQLWDAFATKEGIEHWFAPDARVESGVGGMVHMSWLNEYTWASPIAQWDPPRHMRVLAMEQIGEANPDSFGYDIFIEPIDDETSSLRLVHFGFPRTPEGDAIFELMSRGWNHELEVLRLSLDRHAGEPRQIVYSRGFLGEADLDEIWARTFSASGLFTSPALARAEPGDRFEAKLGGVALEGIVRACEPGTHMIVDLESQNGAVLHLTTEPCIVDEGNVLSLFINMWGQSDEMAQRMHADAERRIARMLGTSNVMPPFAGSR